MRKLVLIPLVLLSFTGCVSTYVAPASGPTAKLNIRNQSNFQLAIVHYNDAKKCTDSSVVPLGLNPYSDLTVTIRANTLEVFTFQPSKVSWPNYLYCRFIPSFTPEENKLYTATLSVKNNVCSVAVFDEGTKLSVKGLVMREFNQPLLVESEGFCKPLAE